MSTRALYTFKGKTASDSWNVYKHSDGYPLGAARTLQDTLQHYAWVLPRYEADEFAAAFCAAGKSYYYLRALEAETPEERDNLLRYTAKGEHKMQGGGVRMMPQGNPFKVAHKNCADIEYRYEIFAGNAKELRIRAYAVNMWGDTPTEELLTDCPFVNFVNWADAKEKESA
jgi:hypothetical protein